MSEQPTKSTTPRVTSPGLRPAVLLGAGLWAASFQGAWAQDTKTVTDVLNQDVARSIASELEQAGRRYGLKLDDRGRAYVLSNSTRLAGARVVAQDPYLDFVGGDPIMLMYLTPPGVSGAGPGFYSVAVEEPGIAVFRDSGGGVVGRGIAELVYHQPPEEYCEFEPYDDNVCLNCEGPHVPDEFGGTWTWSVCFKTQTTFP